jgi:phosphoglucosamine mutase
MAERKLFGTDGVRGKSNVFPMTGEVALRIGIVTGHLFREMNKGKDRHQIIIGKDTRLSGYMLENALSAGFTSVGMDVILVGPLPTPAMAMLTRSMRVDLGVMISASHNPYDDNGIKMFAPDGYKLSDEVEKHIEDMLDKDLSSLLVPSSEIGRITRLESARGRYVEFVKSAFPKDLRLDGLKVVVDCANGASYKVAPSVLWELGAEVIPMSINPNGRNINDNCGALYPESMCKEVVRQGADIGISLDGDADRVIISDENGCIVDGDKIIALIASDWKERGLLKDNTVVTTVMSNLGLEKFLDSKGIKLLRSAVGDRYVVEMMNAQGVNLGGEQSGHIVLGAYATTGDGIMSALEVLSFMVRKKKKVSEAMNLFTPYPQILKNVRLQTREKVQEVLDSASVKSAIEKAEKKLQGSGRILIRKSGTEPLARVMAEGEDESLIDKLTEDICEEIRKNAGE